MDEKQMNITTSAYLKSIIEAKYLPEDWEEMTKYAIRVHYKVMAEWKAKQGGANASNQS